MNIGAYQKWYTPYSFRNCQRLNALQTIGRFSKFYEHSVQR